MLYLLYLHVMRLYYASYHVVAGPVDQNSVDNWKLTAEKLGQKPLVISVR